MDGDLLHHVAKCVGKVRTSAHSELELRLGSMHEGVFIPGVPKDVCAQLEEDFLSNGLKVEGPPVTIFDYHFTVGVRGQVARTRVHTNSDSLTTMTTHACKELVTNMNVGGLASDVCRVSHCTETPLENPPTVCMPHYVRLKQRTRYLDVRRGAVVWSYEVSRTWSAPTRTAVEEKQQACPPIYEVECELVDEGGHYLRDNADRDVGLSILTKAHMLMGCEFADLTHLSSTLASKKRKTAHVSPNKGGVLST